MYYLILSSILFFFFRLPSLFEPYWYGDEGVYQVIGMAIQAGRTVYTQTWDNKPPLLFFLYGLANGEQFYARLLSLLFGLASVISFYFLGRTLFKRKIAVFISTVVFAVIFASPIIEGNIANTENFMLLPILLAAQVLLNGTENKNILFVFVAGIFSSLACLFKVVGVFDTAAFGLFLLFNQSVKSFAFYALGWIIPIVSVFAYLHLNGVFGEFVKTALIENVGYVNYGNNFFIPQGLLFMKLSILILAVLCIIALRKKLGQKVFFVFLWFAFSVFNVFFSSRPYTHYLLLLLPTLVLLLGIFIEKQKFRYAVFCMLVSILLVVDSNFIIYRNVFGYYGNTILYAIGKKIKSDYQSFFDPNVPRDYLVASYIREHTAKEDNIFIWGNNPQIYKLTDKLPPSRFSPAYHIKANEKRISETAKALEASQPKYIVLFPIYESFPFSLEGYMKKEQIENAIVYEKQ